MKWMGWYVSSSKEVNGLVMFKNVVIDIGFYCRVVFYYRWNVNKSIRKLMGVFVNYLSNIVLGLDKS